MNINERNAIFCLVFNSRVKFIGARLLHCKLFKGLLLYTFVTLFTTVRCDLPSGRCICGLKRTGTLLRTSIIIRLRIYISIGKFLLPRDYSICSKVKVITSLPISIDFTFAYFDLSKWKNFDGTLTFIDGTWIVYETDWNSKFGMVNLVNIVHIC